MNQIDSRLRLLPVALALGLACLLAACQPTPPATPSAQTPTAAPTSTPLPPTTAPTPTATSTNTPIPTDTPTPTPVPVLKLPVLAGTPVPQPEVPISPDNAAEVVELAIRGKGEAQEVAFSPDGKLLAVGTTVGIWLYDAQTLASLRFINVGTEVTGLTFSPSGEKVFAGTGGGALASWDVSTGEILSSLKVREGLMILVFSLNGTTLAALPGRERSVELWDVESGTRLELV